MKTGSPQKRNLLAGFISFIFVALAFTANAQNVWIKATPDTGCAPLQVQFSDSSAPGHTIMIHHWDFGDGDTSALANPIHLYNAAGIYSVQLRAYDIMISDYDTVYTTITVLPGPTVTITTTNPTPGNCDGTADVV